MAAVERAVSNPAHLSATRRALAAELFHGPGQATGRAVHELYALMELDLPASVQQPAPIQNVVDGAARAFSR